MDPEQVVATLLRLPIDDARGPVTALSYIETLIKQGKTNQEARACKTECDSIIMSSDEFRQA